MRISWNWLSEWVNLEDLSGPQALADLLTQRGFEVEALDCLDQGFEKVITAQILERNRHPQADRLSVCKMDVGFGEPLEVVCGAQNMKAGDIVALARVGAELPNGLKISQSKIRGIVSNGMLCSEEELKLKDRSEGILILPTSTAVGQPLAQFLGRDDALFTLKLTANRGDCLSHMGIAREVAAALGKTLHKPTLPDIPYSHCPISIELAAGDLAPQFFGCWIEGVKIGPSPSWLIKRLEALGRRSINNVVDASNWVMLEMGHPTHAYDGEQIQGKKIQVRMAKEGEQLSLLDGSTVTLSDSELVIADQNRPIGLAGVMGGSQTEVQPQTLNLFLECAEFSPVRVRRAASHHQKKTDASHRFERGVDPLGLPIALARLVQLATQLAGGRVIGAIQVKHASRAQFIQKQIRFGTHFIHDFLGFKRDCEPLTLERVNEIFLSLDCEVESSSGEWRVRPPSYRMDLSLREDLAEEVARSLGYDKIPTTLPPLSSSPAFSGSFIPKIIVMDRAKDILVRNGLLEAVNFSFTSGAWLSRFGFSSKAKVLNPLSEEYEFLVPSLLPGLIRNAVDNEHRHFGSEPLAIRLFEFRPTFTVPTTIQAKGQVETGVHEVLKLSLILSGPRYAEALRSERGEVDFSDLKGVIDSLLTELGTRGVRYQAISASQIEAGSLLFHPGQSVEVLVGNSVAGYFGLLHPAKAKELKNRAPFWLAELNWDVIAQLSRKATDVPVFKAWPEFPSIERDFALVIKNDVSAEKICQLATKVGKPLAQTVKVFDIYRGSQVAEGMTSIAVRVIFNDIGRSLQESEAEAVSARIVEAWKKELGAKLRS